MHPVPTVYRTVQYSLHSALDNAGMDSYIRYRPEGGKPYTLTESREKLVFYYKNRFSELRNASHIVLNIEGNTNSS